MRVISGRAGGRQLKAPKNQALTRPMADKIKEALYSALDARGIAPERVLDLYAGSGSIGIEALSRGAEWADFVDRDRRACQAIRDNLRATKLQDLSRVHQTSINRFIERVREPYDFVILDPPYAAPDIIQTLEQLSESQAVRDATIVVLGHWPRLEIPERIGRLVTLKDRCHGDSCYTIFEVVIEDVEEANGG